MKFLLSEERRNYYKAKKAEVRRKAEESKVYQEDALFIKYYGMEAFIQLFPEAKNMGISWHRAVLAELQKLEKRKLVSELSGMSMAIGANLSKKSARKFKRTLKDMLK